MYMYGRFYLSLYCCFSAKQSKAEPNRAQQGDHVHEEAAIAAGSQQPVAAGGHYSPRDRAAALQTCGQEEPQFETLEHLRRNGRTCGE